MKIQPPNREEIFANLILDKGLISRIYNTKDSQNSVVKKTHAIRKWERIMNTYC